MRVYVTQFGVTWSLTPQAWRQACEVAVAGQEWDLDDYGRRLSRQLSKWKLQHRKTIDWDDEQWDDALQAAKEAAP